MICKCVVYILLLSGVLLLVQSQKAIIFSSSIGYYNYRQTSNALKIYHKLKELGFSDQDILLMIPQNTGCCEKNPLYGTVSFVDNDYTNINENVEIDFDFTDMNVQRVIDLMRFRFAQSDIAKIKLEPSREPEPLFIYITGHGGNTYFKVREREAIIMENFKALFEDLELSNKFSKILLFSDSCSAITPFQTVEIQNFTAFASSSWDQKSQSHGYDTALNAPKSDDFTFYLIQYLDANDPRQRPIKLKDLFDEMSYERLSVHSKIVGKGKKTAAYINDFLVKKPSKFVKKAFRLQKLI